MAEIAIKGEPAPIPHNFWAKADDARRGWLAMYSAPTAGARHVRDAEGVVIFFETEERALLAASRAMCRALDAGRADRTAAHRAFKPVGTGRNRRFAAV